MAKGHIATGTVEGTGAAINVQVGFEPNYVRLINIDGLATAEWCSAVSGSSLKEVTAGTKSAITTTGISTYAGTSAGDNAGFTIGADADVNVSAETLFYIAIGSED